MIHDFSIWEQVRLHTWKYQPRNADINGLLWHCTRGGQWYDAVTEQRATINWFTSSGNIIHRPDGNFAGISNYLIGPQIVEVIPLEYVPRWSSWPSDLHSISVEVCQSNLGQPIEPRVIENCKRLSKWAEEKYGIPHIRVLSSLGDSYWTGHIGHEDTMQGKASGKTDPGSAFWDPFWEEDLTEDEVKAIVDNALAVQFLELFQQVVGVKENTYSDTAAVQAIRDKIVNKVMAGLVTSGGEFKVDHVEYVE